MTHSYPEFSPTLSEEEKLNDRRNHSFNLSNQIRDLVKDRNFLLIAFASGMILVANEEIHSVLSVLFFQIYEELLSSELYLRELYDVCTCVGLLTFGTALFSRLSLKIGFKFVVFIFSLSKSRTGIHIMYSFRVLNLGDGFKKQCFPDRDLRV